VRLTTTLENTFQITSQNVAFHHVIFTLNHHQPLCVRKITQKTLYLYKKKTMATYKKNGWTSEEKKIIDTTKSTLKIVFESVKTSLFPGVFSGYTFEEFKESFIYRYVRNFVGGLLIIGFLILILILFAMFVTWGLPKPDHEPMSEGGKMVLRLLLLGYSLFVLFLTGSEGD